MVEPKRSSGFRLQWLVWAALLAVALYAGTRLMGGGGAPAGGMPPGGAPPVSVAEALSRPVIEWQEFSGIVEAINRVELRPRIGGHIAGIHFTDGAEVKKGQLLFTIDPRPYEAALLSAKAALVEAESALARAKKLVGSNAISRAEHDAAKRTHDQALGNHRAAQLNLEYTRITAPIAGKISRAEITLGNLVDPAAAPLLASIVDLSPIYASFEVDEQTYLNRIQGVSAAKRKEIPVEVTFGNAKAAATPGAIHSFDNQLTPGSGTIRVRAVLENSDQTLLPGLYAQVRLGSRESADAVLIHPTAVNTDQDRKFLYVVNAEGKAEYRPVTLGQVQPDGLQVVRQGLAAGEKIVVSGLQRVQPGAPVTGVAVDMTTLKPLDAPADAAASDAPPEAPATE
jgi:multidrug efflux system membrane fusion protein